MRCIAYLIVGCFLFCFADRVAGQSLAGIHVIPHVQSDQLRYRRPPDPGLGARVELFLRNDSQGPLANFAPGWIGFDGKTPRQLLDQGTWAWSDVPNFQGNGAAWMPGDLCVLEWNARSSDWGVSSSHTIAIAGKSIDLKIAEPEVWISAVTFLGRRSLFDQAPDSDSPPREAAARPSDEWQPSRIFVYVRNGTENTVAVRGVRLWLPRSTMEPVSFSPSPWQRELQGSAIANGIASHSVGGFSIALENLPLTYAVIELEMVSEDAVPFSLWARQRIRRESFEIGGGWVASPLRDGNSLEKLPYLKTLRSMHLSTGMHQHVPGYTDTDRFESYPLKYMNRLQPLDEYDRDDVLSRIHAVEFLGEPQYGGGRPVSPQQVFEEFLPYRGSRLATSVTHSEERVWRYYAGLSDFPHFDAYRVTAPAADAWNQYDRWGGQRIRWGAPLETIGEMTRSLRDMYRPRPIAYWSQGAHDGWGGLFGFAGRARTSPTPEELRAQAFQALSNRITSLYWFNLSLRSLVKFRDLIEPIRRVNREIRMLEPFLLEGDACSYQRRDANGSPDWDLATIVTDQSLLCFAIDLAYHPDPAEKVFRFEPRKGTHRFDVPPHLKGNLDVFRVDADGVHEVDFRVIDGATRSIEIRDTLLVVGLYVATTDVDLRNLLARRHETLLRFEQSFQFDPAGRDEDFETLRSLLR